MIENSFEVWKHKWRILQNIPAYQYKMQVEIEVASIALHNYIRRRSHNDIAFVEFDHNPNFVHDKILPDVIARSGSHGNCN